MKTKTEWFRKGNVIINADTKEQEVFESINKAKKHSRSLQPVLGDGTVRLKS
jgi:hypothetical protein